MGDWETVPLSQCSEKTGGKPLTGRWVDINKRETICHNCSSIFWHMKYDELKQ